VSSDDDGFTGFLLCVVGILGISLIGVTTYKSDVIREIQGEAVRRGQAEFILDSTNSPVWQWKEAK